MKYAVETDPGATIYMPNFIKVGSGIRKMTGRGYKGTQTAW
jgi:hypothetical protein